MFDFLKRLRRAEVTVVQERVDPSLSEDMDTLLKEHLDRQDALRSEERRQERLVAATHHAVRAWFLARKDTLNDRGYSVRVGAETGNLYLIPPGEPFTVTVRRDQDILYIDKGAYPTAVFLYSEIADKPPEKAAEAVVPRVLEALSW